MKKLYFDKATNKFCLEENANTISVQIDPDMSFDSIHEYYESNASHKRWSYAYTTVAFDYEMVDLDRDMYMKRDGVDKEEFSLIRVIISIRAYDFILSYLEKSKGVNK